MKTKNKLIITALIFATMTVEATPISLSNKQIEVIQTDVKSGLRDPDSAKFNNIIAKDVVISDGSHMVTVCGFVNAKNGYGGYTGDMPFIGMGGVIDNPPHPNHGKWFFSTTAIGHDKNSIYATITQCAEEMAKK